MDEWHVGDPEDWGDSVGVPDIPYMGYLNDDRDEKEPPRKPSRRPECNLADILGDEAWKLYQEFRDEDALIFIDRALSYDEDHSGNLNNKAIILDALERFEESLDCYNKSLQLRENTVVRANRAIMKKNWANALYRKNQNLEKATDLLNEAINELSNVENKEDLSQYRSLLKDIENRINSKTIYARQEEELKGVPREKLITIVGLNSYSTNKLPESGQTLKLVKEPENPHDKDAIAVYIDEKPIGYVANSIGTASSNSSRASELKKLPDVFYATYLFCYRSSYHLARLKNYIT